MFINEIKKELNLGEDFNSKITILDGKNLIVEGYKKLLEYEETEIIYLTKKNKITICGNNLKISRINRNELLIVGTIKMVKIDE